MTHPSPPTDQPSNPSADLPLRWTPARVAALSKHPHQHKYSHGHAIVVSGGPGKGGAARLAARAALRVGAGLVTLACPQAALAENAAQLTAIMLTPLPDSYTLRGLLSDERIGAICLGPGLGMRRAMEMVPAALWSKRAAVLDADALTAFAEHEPEVLFNQLHAGCVLTPHPGEFRRLFPDLADLPPREGCLQAAARVGACVLLKGEVTWIALPDGRLACHDAAAEPAPWLATAGSGDVLAGLITGLLARGLAPFEAAGTATLLHAAVGRAFGPGLIAEDLPERLPAVLRDLGV